MTCWPPSSPLISMALAQFAFPEYHVSPRQLAGGSVWLPTRARLQDAPCPSGHSKDAPSKILASVKSRLAYPCNSSIGTGPMFPVASAHHAWAMSPMCQGGPPSILHTHRSVVLTYGTLRTPACPTANCELPHCARTHALSHGRSQSQTLALPPRAVVCRPARCEAHARPALFLRLIINCNDPGRSCIPLRQLSFLILLLLYQHTSS